MINKILLAVDGSEYSKKAAKYARDLMRMSDSIELTAIYVADLPNNLGVNSQVNPINFEETMKNSVESILEEIEEVFEIHELTIKTMGRYGNPASIICEVASYENFDLIIIGSRGLSPLKGLFLGSISNKVAHLAPCPVLVVK